MRVLITGITGSLGQEFSKLCLDNGHEVIGYSRCELKQSLIPERDGLTLYLGDVRDRVRLVEASRGVDIIFHFAALKQVDTLERNVEEAIATNTYGTENVLNAQRTNSIKKIVLASTDKAVAPINAYGASKMLAERLVLRNKSNLVCRYGNVLASRGSVIGKFYESLKNEKQVYITEDGMTRFWLTIKQAAEFIYSNGFGDATGVKTPEFIKCSPVKMLADAVANTLKRGWGGTQRVVYIGNRGGEKLHEQLTGAFDGVKRGEELFSDNQHKRFSPGDLEEIIEPIIRELEFSKCERL